MSAFTHAMDTQIERVRGEKGAAALKTTSSALVDLFTKLVRGLDDATLEQLFSAALENAATPEAQADLIVLAFQTRDARGGKGERVLFYKLLLLVAERFGDDTAEALLPLVSEYGYWKDLIQLVALKPAAALAERCVELFAEALTSDAAELAKAKDEKRTPKLSLAAKYAPREGGAFDKKLGLATKLALKLHGTAANKPQAQRRYRKLVASLTAALAVPEVLMASGRWAEIRFASVASLCLQRHRKAFLNELVKGKMTPAMEATGNRHPGDADRVAARQHLREAMVKKSVKGKQLGPHEIVAKLMAGRRSALSTAENDLMAAQWAALRKGVQDSLQKAADARDADIAIAAPPAAAAEAGAAGVAGALASVDALKAALPKRVDLGNLVALVDVSGSMTGTPMEVAIALGILVSELAAKDFRDRVLTFERQPSWVDLSKCADIAAKVAKVQSAGYGGSTDFAAACERILAAAEQAKLTPDQIPDLLVLSDMQFNYAGGLSSPYGGYYGARHAGSGSSWETHYERLERRFAEVGRRVCGQPWAPPRIIFWNLRANTVGFPVDKDAPNVQMLSGFSPALLKLVLTGAELVVEEEEVVQPDGTVKVKRSGPTPEQTVRAALDDTAYDAVRLKLSELKSGPFAEYKWETRDEAGFELVDVA